MAKFRFTAVAEDGSEVTGTEAADSAAELRLVLVERDLHLVEASEKKGFLSFELTKKRVPKSEIMHLSRQLAAFVRAGVPLLDAIDSIAEETANSRLRSILQDVGVKLRRGDPLSEAIAFHHSIFPPYYPDMLRAAEMTGHLDTVLDQLSRYIERDLEARRKVKSALTYPAIIAAGSLVTVVILAVFVLPRFRKFFESMSADLPMPTRIVLGASDFLGKFWWALIAAAVLTCLTVFLYVRTPRGRMTRDRLMLRLPVVGEVVRFAIVERLCRILSSMIIAGVPLPDGMRLAAQSSSNKVFETELESAREAMLRGEGVARPMARTGLFPPSLIQMMKVGENTGTLDQQLETAGHYYEQELDYKIKRLTALFEPAVIVGVGAGVGFVALALVSAMYGIFRQSGNVG